MDESRRGRIQPVKGVVQRDGWLRSLVMKAVASGCILLVIAWLGSRLLRGATTPVRYHARGTVTFAGQPVQDGLIAFEPHGAGRYGGGHAIISSGRYDTRSGGRGHLGGPHLVRIDGFSTESTGTGNADAGVLSLFPTYETDVILQQNSAVMNFDVPAKRIDSRKDR